MIKLGTYASWFDGEIIAPGENLVEVLHNLEAWGYQGVQFARRFGGLSDAEVKAALATSNIKLCIAGGGGGIISADPEARKQGIEQIKAGLRRAADLGAIGSIVVPGRKAEMTPAPGKTLFETQMDATIEAMAAVAPVAEETGTWVVLEPLNRYESEFLQFVGDGAKICRAVGSPNIKVMADFFHMNIEEVDLGKAIEEAADVLGYVHLADSNRYQPGAGHLDFRPGLAALKRIGYDGYMTLECKVMGADKGKALADSAALVRRLWDEL